MAHQRKVIRDKVVALLSGETEAEARIYASRIRSIRNSEFPLILVYTRGEQVDGDPSTAPRELTRRLDVEIAGAVVGLDEAAVEDALDALALEIETAMHADPYLAGEAGDSILVGTESDIDQEGDRLIGMVQLTYSVTYRTMAPEAVDDEELDDFLTVAATHKTGGVDQDDDDDAEDLFTVQEVA